jgi:hypothetical protein
MMNLTKSELASIVEIYLLANTPAFLFRRMRSNPVVQRLAESESERSLVSEYRSLGRKTERDIEEVASAYAALCALTLREPPPSRRTFSQLAKVDFDWGATIVEKFRALPASSTSATFTVRTAKFATPQPTAGKGTIRRFKSRQQKRAVPS